MQSYNQIKSALSQFANAHLSLRRFKMSFFEQMPNFSTADETFPILYAIPNDVSLEENINVFSFRIYVIDLLQKDRSNEADVLNDTLLIQRDLRNWLALGQNDLNVLNNPTAIPVNNFLMDFTAGWYMDVDLEVDTENNDCSIPFSSNFVLTGLTCDFSYASPYLTCQTLQDCQTILNIEGDITNIYDILSTISGGTGADYWTSGSTGNYSVKQITDTATDALGDYSVAQGISTIVYSVASHSEGEGGIVTNYASHAEGQETIAGKFIEVSTLNTEETEIIINGDYTGFFELTQKVITLDSANNTQDYSNALIDIVYDSINDLTILTFNIGFYLSEPPAYILVKPNYGYTSHAEGDYTKASGDGSHAEGNTTLAIGSFSHSEGENTIAKGQSSNAQGASTKALGDYSHSEGVGSQSIGQTSHAEGTSTIASGFTSHSEGQNTQANGDVSHAEGKETEANGFISHAEGFRTKANGELSHAEGFYSEANGYGSFVNGDTNKANGTYSAILGGVNNTLDGNYSTILGGQNISGTTDYTTYVPYLNISNINSSAGDVLGRDPITGEVVIITSLGNYLPLSGGTMDDNAIIFFNNGSALQEGNYDFGGQGGISQICSVAFELNWQAGSEYVFDNNGLIRIAQFKFNTAPDVNSDSSQRFKVGSRWILDDGTSYVCTDNTVGAAVWNLEANGTTVTGVTWSPNTLTVAQSDGSTYDATISAFTAFNYTDGGQQLGRILTSDANGNASWQVPTVGTSLTYFFNNLSAGTSTYYQAKTDVQFQALETITNLNVVNNQFLAGFITDAGQPGLTFIPGGIVNLHIHAANTNNGKDTELYFELYKRTTGGTETLMGASNLTLTLGNLQSGVETDLAITATTLNVTDRLVTKVYARVTGGGPAPHIDLYLADATLSRVQIPAPVLNFTNYVPYSGATSDVNLGTHSLIATTISATTYQGLPVYARLNDNDIVNFFNYCGLAISGTSQNSPTWQISRISWSSTTPTTAYAVGAWSGRTSLIYS